MPFPNVRVQAIAVVSSSSDPVEITEPSAPYPGASHQSRFPSNTSMRFDVTPRYENVPVTISTVPVVWESDLLQEYRELGDALAELQQLDDDDEWKIDAPVYDAASNVAFVLMMNSLPAPQILHHGSDSVVFNWTNNANNLYLTISSDKMSALISSPERIKRRIEFSPQVLQNPIPAVRYLQWSYLDQ
jgi:hypothetical protein